MLTHQLVCSYRQVKMFCVEEHQRTEQDVRRMGAKLFALPEMLLFDTSNDIF